MNWQESRARLKISAAYFDQLRISLGLGLLICFLLRLPFYSVLLGPSGILSASQADSWKAILTGTSASFEILSAIFLICLVLLITGFRKVIVTWLMFLLLLFIIHLLSSSLFPAYLTLTAEVYFLWPLLLLACQQSRLFESDRWPRMMLIVYVISLYWVPLFGRMLFPTGWLDGGILQNTVSELTLQLTGWRSYLLAHPTWQKSLSFVALALEASSLLLFLKSWRARIGLLLIVFHLVIGLTTFVVFHSLLMISLLVPIALGPTDSQSEGPLRK
jgi:hypothetical protein